VPGFPHASETLARAAGAHRLRDAEGNERWAKRPLRKGVVGKAHLLRGMQRHDKVK